MCERTHKLISCLYATSSVGSRCLPLFVVLSLICLDSRSASLLPFPAMWPAVTKRFRAIHQSQISLRSLFQD